MVYRLRTVIVGLLKCLLSPCLTGIEFRLYCNLETWWCNANLATVKLQHGDPLHYLVTFIVHRVEDSAMNK